MSQADVYEILKSLGGEATVAEIRTIAKKKFFGTLFLYITDRLKKMEKQGIVKKNSSNGKITKWKIIREFS